MKISDDYNAKLRLWAANPRVVALPATRPLPPFRSKRFLTHQEMNEWKLELLRRIAQEGNASG